MTDNANELRRYSRKIGHPAGDVPSVMLAAADEIERLAAKLEAAEKEREIDEQRIADLMAELNRVGHENDKLRAKVERINTLEMALRDVAQTLAWMQHGRCRGFSEGPILTTNEALDAARAALEESK